MKKSLQSFEQWALQGKEVSSILVGGDGNGDGDTTGGGGGGTSKGGNNSGGNLYPKL